jgi:bis(5'-nucleosyl)-tetraphosphatase (symmetrical)
MALYLIGDIQGCDAALQRLLDKIGFSPSRDTIVLLGDLVNRGPDSAAVLRRVQGFGASALSLLGNHDLHLLGVAHGARKPSRKDTLASLLEAPDSEALLEWVRQQHMALHMQIGGGDLLMVHAGVLPQWTVGDTLVLAA